MFKKIPRMKRGTKFVLMILLMATLMATSYTVSSIAFTIHRNTTFIDDQIAETEKVSIDCRDQVRIMKEYILEESLDAGIFAALIVPTLQKAVEEQIGEVCTEIEKSIETLKEEDALLLSSERRKEIQSTTRSFRHAMSIAKTNLLLAMNEADNEPIEIFDVEIDKCLTTDYNEYFGYEAKIGGTVTNMSNTVQTAHLKIGLYDDNDVQVDYTSEFVTIPAGKKARWATTTYTEYDFEKCYIIEVD